MSELKPKDMALIERALDLHGTPNGKEFISFTELEMKAVIELAREEGRAEIRAAWGKAVARD